MTPYEYDHTAHGMENQTLAITLEPGQSIHTENGAMSFMGHHITMSTGAGQRRGPLSLIKRKIAGEDMLVSIFTNEGHIPQRLGISPKQPAHILPITLDAGQPDLICRQGSFLAGHPDVAVSIALTSAKAAVFGNSNLIMQRLHGTGQAFLAANGAVIHKRLGPEELYLTEAEALLAFDDTLDYSTQVPKGLSNVLWSKERLFLLTLEGPGDVWFQSTSKWVQPSAKKRPDA